MTTNYLIRLEFKSRNVILDSPYTARSLENFQKLKRLSIDQLFLIDKICHLRKLSRVMSQNISSANYNLFAFNINTTLNVKLISAFQNLEPIHEKKNFFYSTTKSWNTFAMEDMQKVPLRTMKTNLCKIIIAKYTADNFITHKLL